jgi:hypothetical protein
MRNEGQVDKICHADAGRKRVASTHATKGGTPMFHHSISRGIPLVKGLTQPDQDITCCVR